MPRIITPNKFLCPITHDLIGCPALASDGNVYEWSAIEEWLEKNDTSPVTNLKFPSKELVEAESFIEQFARFQEENQICSREGFSNTLIRVIIEDDDVDKIEKLNYLDAYLGYLDYPYEDEYQLGPLHYAAYHNHTGVMKLLLAQGANINLKDVNEQTPLDIAVDVGNLEAARLLLEKGANVDIKDKEGWTYLHYAIIKENIELVVLLIQMGADTDCKTNEGQTTLEIAEEHDYEDEEKKKEILLLLSQYPHNRQTLTTACQMLTAGRALLHMIDPGSFKSIPNDIRYHILDQLDNQKYLNSEQIERIINYAADKKTIGQSKMQFSQQTLFFKATKRPKESFEEANIFENLSTKKRCIEKNH